MKFDLIIDFGEHPIRHFLQDPPSQPRSRGTIQEFFNERTDLLHSYIQSLIPNQICFLTTHAYPDEQEVTEEARELVRSQLKFKPVIKEKALAIRKSFSGGRYAVLHLRVTDETVENAKIENRIVKNLGIYLKNHVIPKWGTNIALISNSKSLKRAVASSFGLCYVDTSAVHLGECNSVNLDVSVRDTLVDFALMSQAGAIYSYSDYPWKSGFSKQCADLYKIPFVDIKPVIDMRSRRKIADIVARLLKKIGMSKVMIKRRA